MKFKLFLVISLMFASCSGDSVEDETIFNSAVWVITGFSSDGIPVWGLINTHSEIGTNRGENPETNSEIKKYFIYVNSTNQGGSINISSQQDVIYEADLGQVKEVYRLYSGKLAGTFNNGSQLSINAIPNEGFKFVGWSGYKCNLCICYTCGIAGGSGMGSTPFVSDDDSIMLTIQDRSVLLTANFEKK
tara:strand:+ start:55 stop:621 length:567 start_codon:yes stop_codon:yes gene_type:complete